MIGLLKTHDLSHIFITQSPHNAYHHIRQRDVLWETNGKEVYSYREHVADLYGEIKTTPK